MNAAQAAAFISAQTALLNCRVAGMTAENQLRLSTVGVAAYGDEAFAALERQYEYILGHNAVLTLYQGCTP